MRSPVNPEQPEPTQEEDDDGLWAAPPIRLEVPYLGRDRSERLDRFVSQMLPAVSRAFVQEAIHSGHILVHQSQEKASYRLRYGDLVVIALPPRRIEPTRAEPEPMPLSILYEDDDIIVINKQAPLVVHPAPGLESGTLVNALLHHFAHLSSAAGQLRPGIVHRLDKDTTGAMVIAKNDRAHNGLAEQLAQRTMSKVYAAIVYGSPQDEGTIDAPIGRHPLNPTKMTVVDHIRRGRHALTHYWVEERFRGMARVRVKIETGRTHQIRVHLTHIGYPVVGDPVYGAGRSRPKEIPVRAWEDSIGPAVEALAGQALHAEQLGFAHPRTGRVISFTAPWPEDMQELLRRLRENETSGDREARH